MASSDRSDDVKPGKRFECGKVRFSMFRKELKSALF